MSTITANQFGLTLEKIRRENLVTLQQLSHRTGLSFNYILDMEIGAEPPPDNEKIIEMMEQFLGVTDNKLVEAARNVKRAKQILVDTETSHTDANDLYYIQNGFVGNAVSWWGINSNGYTTDLTKAGKYTKEETIIIIRRRPEDRAWSCRYIDNNEKAKKLIIDGQYLDNTHRFLG